MHDEKANHIVHEVLRRIDTDRNGLITQREFVAAGADGLPSFAEYGKGVLGHHYGERSIPIRCSDSIAPHSADSIDTLFLP